MAVNAVRDEGFGDISATVPAVPDSNEWAANGRGPVDGVGLCSVPESFDAGGRVEAREVGIIGAGVMGSEIAHVVASAGAIVRLRDVDGDRIAKGLAHVAAICVRRVARGRMSQETADLIISRVHPALSDDDLAECDLVIEAATEVMEVKTAIASSVDRILGTDAILASNTSGLSITEIGRSTQRPDRVVGLHFFNPASVMALVEVVRGEDTSDATLQSTIEMARAFGKHPVVVKECPGFLVNRMLCRGLTEAYRATVSVGADRASVDAAVVSLGPAPMGPYALGDLVGIDTLSHVFGDLATAYGDRFSDDGVAASMVDAGRLGAKSGGGFLTDTPADTTLDDNARTVAEHYYLGVFDEACRCLEEGISAPGDVDVSMVLGTGWSVGPLAWADEIGPEGLRERLTTLARRSGDRFAPRPALLHRLSSGVFESEQP
jgi:3-hydroxybutyryl-CoA dehydrogenase